MPKLLLCARDCCCESPRKGVGSHNNATRCYSPSLECTCIAAAFVAKTACRRIWNLKAVSLGSQSGRALHCGSAQPDAETSNHPLSHELGNEWASERASVQTNERVSKMSSAEQANEWEVRVNKRMDERVAQYLRLDPWLYWTTVRESAVSGETGTSFFMTLSFLILALYWFPSRISFFPSELPATFSFFPLHRLSYSSFPSFRFCS